MLSHEEKRVLPYTPEQLFDLVADVERYPEFLPWCLGARIRERRDDIVLADMLIGFKMIREKFTSRVVLQRPGRIDVAYTDGPFKYLKNHWIFEPMPGSACRIDFYVEFEFRSALLTKVMGVLFGEAVRRMVTAFEARARALYGDSGVPAVARPAS
ncbi:MAG TPA: type II toxin-antitoxin system RatA family toxin [Stellaceae bacterium]|jgi:coenzyme Q-binding protein COQ10